MCATDHYDQVNDDVRQQRQTSNGVGVVAVARKERSASRRGQWAGHIDKLFPLEERERLTAAAISAGLLTASPVDRVRFLALCLQAKTRPPEYVTGYLVERVESGTWGDLDPKYVKQAMDRLRHSDRLLLTKEEINQVRTPRGPQ